MSSWDEWEDDDYPARGHQRPPYPPPPPQVYPHPRQHHSYQPHSFQHPSQRQHADRPFLYRGHHSEYDPRHNHEHFYPEDQRSHPRHYNGGMPRHSATSLPDHYDDVHEDEEESDDVDDPWRPPSAQSETRAPRQISTLTRSSPPPIRHSYSTRASHKFRTSSKPQRASPPPFNRAEMPSLDDASRHHQYLKPKIHNGVVIRDEPGSHSAQYVEVTPPPAPVPPPLNSISTDVEDGESLVEHAPATRRRRVKTRSTKDRSTKSQSNPLKYLESHPTPESAASYLNPARALADDARSSAANSPRTSATRLALPIRSQTSVHDEVDKKSHKTRDRRSKPPSPEPHFQIPGGFPFAPDTVLPDDSRSTTSRPRAASRPSLTKTAQSSISQVSSSSGTLGPKAYQYMPLGEHEMRLVKILPARMSTIKCELLHASLDHPPDYVAISYAWGDADDTKKVLVEGAVVPVAVSLHGALGALRQKDKSVYVWVDALCIDQQNKEERAEQVRFMTSIYTNATSVAIWLGPEEDESSLAMQLLEDISENLGSHDKMAAILSNEARRKDFAAVVALFERDYWRRLWVVQEVYNAKEIDVYCDNWVLPWHVFKDTSSAFWRYREHLDYYFPRGLAIVQEQGLSQTQFSVSQVLAYQGPNSIPDSDFIANLGKDPLLGVMCACRRKLTSDPRDKVFGILGVLPESIRGEFPVDYNLSVKEVYINVVDLLLATTETLDVICESIHYPVHTSSINLPTWVPNWSHMTEMTALSHLGQFSAAGKHKAKYRFLDERRKHLEISAIHLDSITAHGMALGTLCTTADSLMAFLHWRAIFLNTIDPNSKYDMLHAHEAFCRTLCIDQVPAAWSDPGRLVAATYHVFASLLRERLPQLPLDAELERYAKVDANIKPDARRGFLQQHFKRMMGRSFCLTENGCMGLGSGYMSIGDIIVVPLGCKTPIILRPEGRNGEYRYIGDIYIHGYMQGKAMDEWKSGEREEKKYVLH